MTWYTLSETHLTLSIFVKIHARKTGILGVHQQHLQIALHAKPEAGKANAELLQLLSTYFKIPKGQITLVQGQQSRYKRIRCTLTQNLRVTPAELQSRLLTIPSL